MVATERDHHNKMHPKRQSRKKMSFRLSKVQFENDDNFVSDYHNSHSLTHTHTHQLSERHFKISNFTFDPVHAATTS